MSRDVQVIIETCLGLIEIAVFASKAPASSQAFLRRVDNRSFTRDGAFYRTVRGQENDRGQPFIDVLQGGLLSAAPEPVPARHEPTSETGIRHQDGAVSLARDVNGSGDGAAFFICFGDQPALDEGGERCADGRGYAVFGRVVRGLDVGRHIHRLDASAATYNPYRKGQMLNPPVRFIRCEQTTLGICNV